MKRIGFIVCVFALLFSVLCMCSCSVECVDDYVAWDFTSECGPYDCGHTSGPTELSGLHINDDCVGLDCYWFPTVCGCYSNAFTDTHMSGVGAYGDYRSCAAGCSSCVIFGFDLTLFECYGDSLGIINSSIDYRYVVDAVEGVDYRIDKVRVTVNDHTKEFSDDIFTGEEVFKFIELLNLGTASEVSFCVEYTALKELHSANLQCDFSYNNDIFTNRPYGVDKTVGNEGNDAYKYKNIQPGKHIIYANAKFKAGDLLQLKNIGNLYFTVRTYEE